jgi:predicted RNase H-like HicB family nuclease
MEKKYPIVIETDEDGVYILSCPIFKGCHAYGQTLEEAMQNITEVIELCAAEENELGKNIYIGLQELSLGA